VVRQRLYRCSPRPGSPLAAVSDNNVMKEHS
jgi:hypothetical protein